MLTFSSSLPFVWIGFLVHHPFVFGTIGRFKSDRGGWYLVQPTSTFSHRVHRNSRVTAECDLSNDES